MWKCLIISPFADRKLHFTRHLVSACMNYFAQQWNFGNSHLLSVDVGTITVVSSRSKKLTKLDSLTPWGTQIDKCCCQKCAYFLLRGLNFWKTFLDTSGPFQLLRMPPNPSSKNVQHHIFSHFHPWSPQYFCTFQYVLQYSQTIFMYTSKYWLVYLVQRFLIIVKVGAFYNIEQILKVR